MVPTGPIGSNKRFVQFTCGGLPWISTLWRLTWPDPARDWVPSNGGIKLCSPMSCIAKQLRGESGLPAAVKAATLYHCRRLRNYNQLTAKVCSKQRIPAPVVSGVRGRFDANDAGSAHCTLSGRYSYLNIIAEPVQAFDHFGYAHT